MPKRDVTSPRSSPQLQWTATQSLTMTQLKVLSESCPPPYGCGVTSARRVEASPTVRSLATALWCVPAPNVDPIGAQSCRMKGYATRKPALIAVSFEILFGPAGATGEGEKALLIIGGECGFDPNKNKVSQIEIKNWTQRIGYEWGSAVHFSNSAPPGSPEKMRIL